MKNVRTKQQFSLAAVTLAAVLVASGFTSCSKSEIEPTPDRSVAIDLSASVQATTESRAAVVGATFPANTANVFRLTAFSGSAAPTTDWSATPYFNDIQVNSDAASALTLASTQCYPANGDNLYFYGYAPQATSLTAGTASAAPIANYTITGQQDIMTARVTTGIAKAATGVQKHPALAFTHKLMQLRFKIVADASYETGKKVSNISVKRVRTSAKLNIATGVLTFDGAADQTLSLPIVTGTNDGITATGIEMDSCIMLESTGAGSTIVLEVTAGDATYNDIELSLTGTDNGTAGSSHLITLTFKREKIIPSAAIADWVAPVDTDVDVDGEGLTDLLPIGEFKGGGIVYAVDGPRAKVLSLDQALDLKWSVHNTYIIGAAGQNMTDGKANVAAMKAYSSDNINNADATKKTTGNFATDFPAAHFCDSKNTGDITGWYLPAGDELMALSRAYGTNKAAIDAGIANNSGIAFPFSGYFWSSTEYSGFTSNAWYVHVSAVNTSTSDKSTPNYVRCVRDIAPPPPLPAIGDYYYSDGSYSTALEVGKTATGMIYYIDPADPHKYKVMSLEEALTTMKWAADNAYVVSGAQSDAEGKANSAAIKAAFDAKEAGVAIAQQIFDDAFPAAAYCYNYRGMGGTDAVGTWHLPAKSELQYLWCSYNNVAPSTGTSLGAPANSAAQATWNTRITTVDGAARITSGYFWSSTEASGSASNAWYVDFSYDGAGNSDKSGTHYVRCVRDL